jgi:hypothetical protein
MCLRRFKNFPDDKKRKDAAKKCEAKAKEKKTACVSLYLHAISRMGHEWVKRRVEKELVNGT